DYHEWYLPSMGHTMVRGYCQHVAKAMNSSPQATFHGPYHHTTTHGTIHPEENMQIFLLVQLQV
ncbi:hypothetical protein HAX54_041724, partial [Datura stramonium]|nr:hypothetical protein [Datura stramonium]